MKTKSRALIKSACIALTLSVSSVAVVAITAEPAFAERGGNGNGGGNRSERSNNRSASVERGGSGNNGRGHLARELGGLNAAHANANAMANASPNSMPGKLNAFRQAQGSLRSAVSTRDDKYMEFQRLIQLTEEEIGIAFPDGGYEDAVTNAAIEFETADRNAFEAQSAADETVSVLTGGTGLSDAALIELLNLLNL